MSGHLTGSEPWNNGSNFKRIERKKYEQGVEIKGSLYSRESIVAFAMQFSLIALQVRLQLLCRNLWNVTVIKIMYIAHQDPRNHIHWIGLFFSNLRG